MAKFFTFAGNLTTGEFLYNAEPVELACGIEDACDDLLKKVGYDNAVWASYDSRNDINACIRDFEAYMKYRGSSEVKNILASDIGTNNGLCRRHPDGPWPK